MRRRTAPAAAAAILTATLLLTGCTASTPNTPTPLGTGTPTGRTPTSPTPSESPTADLFAEASRVYKAQNDAILKYSGRTRTVPAVFKEWAAEIYYDDLVDLFRITADNGGHFLGGTRPTVRIRENTSDRIIDSEVTIDVCLDNSKSRFARKDGKPYYGVIWSNTAYLKHVSGKLKIVRQDADRVTKCPA